MRKTGKFVASRSDLHSAGRDRHLIGSMFRRIVKLLGRLVAAAQRFQLGSDLGMQVTRLLQLEDDASRVQAWDCLAHGNPFRRTAWLHSWWQHYGRDLELFVLQVTNSNGEVVGIAPWYIESVPRMGRVVQPLGAGEVCSEYLGILATPEYEVQVINALANWLAQAGHAERNSQNRWDVLELTSVDSTDLLMRRFTRRLEEVGCHVHCRPAMDCWQLKLPRTWDEYLARLSPNYRSKVRRIGRRWLETGEAELRRATTAEQLQHGMQILIDLHQKRRQSLGEAGCFSSSKFTAFLQEAAERMFRQQALDLYWLELNARPVAVEFQLLGDRVTYAYQSGVEPEALEIQPGRVIQAAVFQDMIRRGCYPFDFLRGNEPYKQQWRGEPHACLDYRVAPHRTAALLRHQMWLAGDTMKQWLKSGLHVAGIN